MTHPRTIPNDDSPARTDAVAARIRETGDGLAAALRALLSELPGRPQRPKDLGQLLGLNRDISGRVLKSAAVRDGLEVVHVAPGPEPLRTVARAAGKRGVTIETLSAMDDAVDRFDRLIRDDAGTRSALDAMIVALVPRARERFELASKQSIFKGISQLKGVHADVWLNATLFHPSAGDDLHHDVVLVHGAIGLQRVRPDARVNFTYRQFEAEQSGDEPSEDAAWRSLERFCTNPPAQLDTHRDGDVIHYSLANGAVGRRAVSDMLVLDHHPGVIDRYAEPSDARPPRNRKGTFVAPDVPVRTLVFDALLHEDVCPCSEPHLAFYDMGPEGMAYVNDPQRDVDLVQAHESVEFLGRDLRRFHAEEVPLYVDMLEHVCGHLGWDPGAFRGFRCRVQYPVHGWQACLSFDPPPPPATP
ncbi:MAG: hypothetical protein ACYTGR_14905 [Planctomycetota bacterium]|jgi:hypothetical protein